MFVELVYDKRNFDGLPGAKDIILGELTRRVHRIFPDADVRVKPMMTLPAINTDASKPPENDNELPISSLFHMFLKMPDGIYKCTMKLLNKDKTCLDEKSIKFIVTSEQP